MSDVFRVNRKRTFLAKDIPLVIVDDAGAEQTGHFDVLFKVLPHDDAKKEENKDKRLLDLTVKEIRRLELADDDGNVLAGNDLVQACINDPAISTAMMTAYNDNLAKKNLGRT